jgi:hypothetical protein
MYTEDDSDNESSASDDDFKPIYKAQKDHYQDLKNLDKPLFLSDLIQSYSSDDYNRFVMGLKQGEELIRGFKLNDLEAMT